MLNRGFRTQESLARYWAEQAVDLCNDIDDESLVEHIEPVHAAIRGLEKDRRIMVIGGDSCGKSTLLSGIAGAPLIARVPLQRHYVCWRYRSADGDATCSRFLPYEHLSGLELVDTQSCSDAAVADTVRQLLQGADVVIATVDGRNYAQSPVWSVLNSMPDKMVGECLLAVTFTEKLAAEAALNLKEKLRDFCREQLGNTLPLYFVNPTAEQDCEVFAERVQEALRMPDGVRATIRRVLDKGVELVRKQGRVLNARAAVGRTDSGFLAGIEQEIDNFLSHQMLGVKQRCEAYVGSVNATLPLLLGCVRRALGSTLSPVVLMRLEQMGAGTEKCFYRMILDEVTKQQQESDEQFILSCAGHWKSVRPRMKKTLECEIGEFPTESLEVELSELRSRMGRELYEPFKSAGLRNKMADLYKKRIGWMRAFVGFVCLFLFVAGVLGFIGQDEPAIYSVGVAGVIWLVGSLAHLVASRRIRYEVLRLAATLEAPLRSAIAAAVEKLVISRVSAYRRLYTAPRHKVAQQEAMLEPLQKRYSTINIQLSSVFPRI
ncbi:MAG: hypothetical protein IJO34_00680 [Akkermansia sp.]|nr:hypothetical protein [Akkermansia sp.]